MKQLLRLRSLKVFALFVIGLAVFKPSDGLSQCALGSQYPFSTVAVPTSPGSININTCNFAGDYNVLSGFFANNSYVLAITGFTPGYVTVYDGANAVVTHGASPFTFVPTVSGTYKIQWSANAGCGPNDGFCHTTSVQMLAPTPPPTPVQDPTAPTCATGTTLTVSGSPATGSQWYWQTSATGTSTATPYAGPYTVFTNSTYYIRTFNTSSNLWSTASSVIVSNMPVATAPPAPVAAQNPACVVPGTTISVSAPGAGYTYYWQGTNPNGSSMAQNASTPYNVSSTGTYYVAAYETATQCWSPGTGVSVTIESYVPATPVLTDTLLSSCAGVNPINISATLPSSAFSSTMTITTNLSVAGGATGNYPGTLTLPAGAVVTSAQLTFNNVTTAGGTWPSDVNVSMTGVATLPVTDMNPFVGGVTNAGPYSLTPTVSGSGAFTLVVNQGYTFGGPVTAGSATLTVNFTLPATVTWMDAPTAGTVLGSGSPFNVVGTSVMPTSNVEGSYDFYAAATIGACRSAGADLYRVNITPVVVAISPVNLTCHGSDDGTFIVSDTTCGATPFTYSVDGGTFGTIPANLTPGVHNVIVKDANNDESATLYFTLTEPDLPQDLEAFDVNYYNAMLTWDAQGSETSWTVIYGETGFDPATEGTTVPSPNDTLMIDGLDVNTTYDFYVYANCGDEAMAGPYNFTTQPGFYTYDSDCGPGFTDISTTGTQLAFTTDTDFYVDDREEDVTLPFTFNYQGVAVNNITIGMNGGVNLNAPGSEVYTYIDGNLALYPYVEDLNTNEVYTQTTGVAPNRKFIIQWTNATEYTSPTPYTDGATFQIVLQEGSGEFFFLYDDVIMEGYDPAYTDSYGADAEIGIRGPLMDIDVSMNDTEYLTDHMCIRFYPALCPNPVDLSIYPFETEVDLSWNPGLYGEANWTVVVVPEGQDPATGTQIPYNSNSINVANLEQNTQYDVYIYAECAADDLTSEGGLFGTFLTTSFCSKPTALNAATDVDSLEASWNWVLNPLYTDYAIESFNIEYGVTGFELGDGIDNLVSSNGTANNDTIFNADFIAGGVYQYYVQAVCGQGDSISPWAGPFTFTMPLSNDLACAADVIPVDGVARVFNNSGGTVSMGENVVAPATTGAQETDGWNNSTLNNTVWFKFTAPASGNLRVNATGINYNGQAAVYQVGTCNDFATYDMMAANDDAIGSTSVAPNFTVCGLEDGEEYYLLFDGFSGTTGNYSLSLSPIVMEAGTAVPVTELCTGDDLDLFETINTNDSSGVWSSSIASVNASIDGSDFESAGLAYTTFQIQYRVTEGCAYDSIMATVQVFAPSNAGQNGTISACRNEPIDLLGGLVGTADLEGTWYDVNDDPITGSEISASNLQGSYSYDYIVSNGVCPADTALVVVNVGSCNFLSLNEEVFNSVEVFPNPSEGIVFISSDISFSYEVTDANGRIITAAANGVKAAQKTEINLNGVERGVYFIRLNNEDAQKTYRIMIR